MKFSYFLIFLVLLFLVATVSAADADLTIPFNQEVDLKRPCFNNGTFCSDSASCNLTVIYPDQRVMIDNKAMTHQGSYFNYTIAPADINQLGIHNAIMSCRDSGGDINGNGEDTFIIEVTGDGNAFNVFPIQLTFLLLGVVLIVIGKTREDFRMLKHMGAIMILVLGVLTLWPGYAFINYSTLLGKTIGFSAIGLGFYFWIEDSFSREKQQDWYAQEEEDDGRFHGND